MSLLYKVIRKIVKGCYKEKTVFGAENIPSEPSLIIGNHAQMHGPLYAELYFPRPKKVWCIGEMLNKKEAPAYAYKDFWSYKPKWCKWFYKLLAHVLSPLLVFLFKNSDTIGVYKDTRVLATFKNTVKALKDGEHVVIFPNVRRNTMKSSMSFSSILWTLRSSITSKRASGFPLCRRISRRA